MEFNNILLGSQSPRRNQLMEEMDLSFRKVSIHTDENFPSDLVAEEVPVYLSQKKASAYEQLKDNEILITADTVVILDQQILEKPENNKEAIQMLSRLSNHQHWVITGVCLTSTQKQTSFAGKTQVFFKELTNEQIEYYVKKYQPMDKAGAYGIQEWIGKIGIEKIEGCFYNVMGLPTVQLYEKLQEF